MTIPIYVGYDEREAIGYHVFCRSVLARTKAKVAFHPVRGTAVEGSTKFNALRFGIARETGFRGWAIWAECDMLCLGDVEELMLHADPTRDVVVAQHAYQTKHPVKFLGQPNPDYPRKNWSSLMLINCNRDSWKLLPYAHMPLSDLHRFKFLKDEEIGALPLEWNHLVGEYQPNPKAKLAHFTIGLPIWPEYANCEFADEWRKERDGLLSDYANGH